MINFIQPGLVITLTAPAGGVVSSQGYVVGNFFAIAAANADAGEKFEGQLVGEVQLNKVAAEAWTEGLPIFWDDTAKLATIVGPANGKIGAATTAAVNPSGTGLVRLDGVSLA